MLFSLWLILIHLVIYCFKLSVTQCLFYFLFEPISKGAKNLQYFLLKTLFTKFDLFHVNNACFVLNYKIIWHRKIITGWDVASSILLYCTHIFIHACYLLPTCIHPSIHALHIHTYVQCTYIHRPTCSHKYRRTYIHRPTSSHKYIRTYIHRPTCSHKYIHWYDIFTYIHAINAYKYACIHTDIHTKCMHK